MFLQVDKDVSSSTVFVIDCVLCSAEMSVGILLFVLVCRS